MIADVLAIGFFVLLVISLGLGAIYAPKAGSSQPIIVDYPPYRKGLEHVDDDVWFYKDTQWLPGKILTFLATSMSQPYAVVRTLGGRYIHVPLTHLHHRINADKPKGTPTS